MASFSIYRGQARHGIGDGDGVPLTGKGGEQYLDAEAPLDTDYPLQDEIRRWSTFSVLPEHYQKLKDKLTAWSCFATDKYFFVVRLVTNKSFDGRVAYFAHARAWPKAENRLNILQDFDLGLYLGQADAFDAPWHDGNKGQRALPPPSFAQLFTQLNPDVAQRFLTNLLYARDHDLSLIVSVPLTAFADESLLPVYIALARAALPKSLQDSCAIRIYLSDSRLFIDKANVLVLAEDQAGSALSRFPNAILADVSGQVKTRNKPSEHYQKYAEMLVEHLKTVSEDELITELTAFSAKFSGDLKNLSLEKLPLKLSETFRLISLEKLLCGSPQRFIVESLLEGHPEEYEQAKTVLKKFPKYYEYIEQAIPSWWTSQTQSDNKVKLERIFVLLNDKFIHLNYVPTDITFSDNDKISAFVDNNPEELAHAIQMTIEHQFSLDWLLHCSNIENIIKYILDNLGQVLDHSEYWESLIGRLFGTAINQQINPCQASITEVWQVIGKKISEIPNKFVFFHYFAELSIHLSFDKKEILNVFWTILSKAELTDRDRESIVSFAVSDKYRWISVLDIVAQSKQAQFERLINQQTSQILFNNLDFLDNASIAILMKAFKVLPSKKQADNKALFYNTIKTEVDRKSIIQDIIDVLISENLWFDWFYLNKASFDIHKKRDIALSWLRSPKWQNWNRNRKNPEPTLEAWTLALSCFNQIKINKAEMQQLLVNDVHTWPNIYPFEDKQLKELCASATLDALALLGNAAHYSKKILKSLRYTFSEELFAILNAAAYQQISPDDMVKLCECDCVTPELLVDIMVTWLIAQQGQIVQHAVFDKIYTVLVTHNNLLAEQDKDKLQQVALEIIVKLNHLALAEMLHPQSAQASNLVSEPNNTSFWKITVFDTQNTEIFALIATYLEIHLEYHKAQQNIKKQLYDHLFSMVFDIGEEYTHIDPQWLSLDNSSKSFLAALISFFDYLQQGSIGSTSGLLKKTAHRRSANDSAYRQALNEFLAPYNKTKLVSALSNEVDKLMLYSESTSDYS